MNKLSMKDLVAFTTKTFDGLFGNDKWTFVNSKDHLDNKKSPVFNLKNADEYSSRLGTFSLTGVTASGDRALATIQIKPFPSACGIVISHALSIDFYGADIGIGEAMIAWQTEYVKWMGYGMIIYTYSDNQQLVTKVLKGEGFKNSAKFTSPRTNNVCTIATLDITK